MSTQFEILNDSIVDSDGVSASEISIYSYHTHTHLYYEMLLYEPFNGTIKINERELKITEPTAILIAPGDFHRTDLSGEASRVIKLQCNASKLGQTYLTSMLVSDDTNSIIKELFYAGLKYRYDKDYLLAVIRMAASEITFHGQALSVSVSGKAVIVSKAMQYINRNFQADASLLLAAEEQYISPQYLSGIFAETAGITFRDYLIEKRLSTALALLKDGKHSATDARYECGYTNLSHFIRSFKRKYGMSPGKFIKQHNHDE